MGLGLRPCLAHTIGSASYPDPWYVATMYMVMLSKSWAVGGINSTGMSKVAEDAVDDTYVDCI